MYENRGPVRSCWPRIRSVPLGHSPAAGLVFQQPPSDPSATAHSRSTLLSTTQHPAGNCRCRVPHGVPGHATLHATRAKMALLLAAEKLQGMARVSPVFPRSAQAAQPMNHPPVLLSVEARINAPVADVWTYWVTPEHITRWNAASEDWHTPSATNDLRIGGTFTSRMEAKDGSMGFDFSGTYTELKLHALIVYRLGDGAEARDVRVVFEPEDDTTIVRETFTPETMNPIEAQRSGWQSILDRFKSYVEAQP
ncbi:SRPBCC family protein [Cyanobium gracile]|uniref:SRPBCC family protein n=1 Tax=Cyanobium gracile UHCC 0281 TaxID=3110309 RepID=A0ABU5T085_9CYAN|nr:SRPBCC family protein [Cyanobium gracile]MEA5444188.1 SRPBCC family protein [Cyanobium gracile UHCC 0281]